MTPTDLFFSVFAAVMCAGLLLVTFVWGMVTYSRYERDGIAGRKGTGGAALAILMPLLVTAIALMIASDKVPAWLAAILI